MIDYQKKFNIKKEVIEAWKQEPIFLAGENDVLIILVHGWSLTPRQMLGLAKHLNKKGYSVSLPRLSGHGTKPEDLEKVKWRDWVGDLVKEIRKQKQKNKFRKIVIGGTSMGGNVCLLASLEEKVDGIILIGVPVHFKNHFFIKLGSMVIPIFSKYVKKVRPQKIGFDPKESYQYFPMKNSRQVLYLVRNSVFSLKKVTAPLLVLQTRKDFFVTKYSPWIIYKNVSSRIKKMQWLETESENHVPQGKEVGKMAELVEGFVEEICFYKDID